MRYLTYAEAAKRVGRSEVTIRRWVTQGMPVKWQVIQGRKTRVVFEPYLLNWFRKTLSANPVKKRRPKSPESR